MKQKWVFILGIVLLSLLTSCADDTVKPTSVPPVATVAPTETAAPKSTVAPTETAAPKTIATNTPISTATPAFTYVKFPSVPGPKPTVETQIGPMPQDCPKPPSPVANRSFSTFKGIGEFPLWFLADTNIRELPLQLPNRTEYGYPDKTFWIMDINHTGPVELRGANYKTNEPLWFMYEGILSINPVLDPGKRAEKWMENFLSFPSTTFLPGSGCYYYEARWAGGSWRVNFVAGHV